MIHSLSTLSTRLLLSWKQKAPFYYDIRRSYSVFSATFPAAGSSWRGGVDVKIKALVSATLFGLTARCRFSIHLSLSEADRQAKHFVPELVVTCGKRSAEESFLEVCFQEHVNV